MPLVRSRLNLYESYSKSIFKSTCSIYEEDYPYKMLIDITLNRYLIFEFDILTSLLMKY